MGPINANNKRQLWLLEGKKGGNFEIINGSTDNVLTEDDGNLKLKRGTANSHQVWKLEFESDHEFRIRKAKSQNEYVVVQNGEIVLKAIHATQADVWLLQPVLNNTVLNKSCFIISTDARKLIDIPEATFEEGAKIGIFEANYRYNQRWNIFRAGEIYVIKSHFNCLNLDVSEEKFEEGRNIVQWPSHGGVNQFWMFEKVSPHEKEYRICTVYDRQLELGHHKDELVLHNGRKFTWLIEGYFPE
jgi:hypothetical protein